MCHIWVESVVGSRLAPRIFFADSPVFLPPQKLIKYIYVIYRAGGPYEKKPVPEVLSTQDQGHSFFPIWTDLAW